MCWSWCRSLTDPARLEHDELIHRPTLRQTDQLSVQPVSTRHADVDARHIDPRLTIARSPVASASPPSPLLINSLFAKMTLQPAAPPRRTAPPPRVLGQFNRRAAACHSSASSWTISRLLHSSDRTPVATARLQPDACNLITHSSIACNLHDASFQAVLILSVCQLSVPNSTSNVAIETSQPQNNGNVEMWTCNLRSEGQRRRFQGSLRTQIVLCMFAISFDMQEGMLRHSFSQISCSARAVTSSFRTL